MYAYVNGAWFFRGRHHKTSDNRDCREVTLSIVQIDLKMLVASVQFGDSISCIDLSRTYPRNPVRQLVIVEGQGLCKRPGELGVSQTDGLDF